MSFRVFGTGICNSEMSTYVVLDLLPAAIVSQTQSSQKDTLFDASHAKHTPPTTRPIEQQGERESQRLWQSTVNAIIARDHEVATDEKTKIEDRQREEAAKRAEQGVEWHPRLFRPVHGGPGGSDEGEEDLDWILNADV